MAYFTFTINGNTYTSDPTNTTVPDGYRFIKYGYMSALANLAQDIVAVMTASIASAAAQVGLATAQANAAASSAATALNAPGTNATSTTNMTVGMGARNMTIQTGKSIALGAQVVVASTASPKDWMAGTVTAYNAGTGDLSVWVTNIGLSTAGVFPTAAAWTVSLAGAPGISGVLNELKGNAIASAVTINLDNATGNLLHISGSTPISAMTLAAGSRRTLIFDAVTTLINSASLKLAGGANITTAVGDMAVVYGDGGGVTLVNDYIRANGQAVTIPTGLIPIGGLMAFDSDVTANTYTAPNGDQYLKTGVIADTSVYPNAPAGPWGSVAAVTPNNTPSSSVQSLASGGGVWICGNSTGQVARSTDGMNWSTATTLTGFTGYVTVAYGNGYFVAVDSSTSNVAKSTDGLTWTYSTLPITNAFALTYGGTTWVAACNNSTSLATSTDGVSWTARTNSRTWTGSATKGPAIAYGNGIFVLIDQATTLAQLSTSPDGINWTNRAISGPTTGFTSIAFGAGIFVICGNEGSSANVIRTSTDGITWTPRTSGGSTNVYMGIGFVGSKFVFSSGTVTWTSSDGITWVTTSSGSSAASLMLYASNGTYHIGMLGGAAARSDNAVNWLKIGMQSGNVGNVDYGGGRWFTSQSTSSFTGFSYSTDGSTWLQAILPGTDTWNQSHYFNSLYGISGANFYYTSPDLINWTSRALPTSVGGGFSVANGRLYSLGSTGTAFSYSADGITFSNASFADSRTWKGVVYGNSTYVVYDAAGNINTSTDGLSWITRTPGFSGSIVRVMFASGFFISVTSSGLFYKSSDGITWTPMTQAYGIATGVDAAATDGTQVVATSGANLAVLIWPGTGNNYYRRVTTSVVNAQTSRSVAFGAANTFVARIGSATAYIGTMSATNKVLNDTNLKTYNSTTASQTDFYKRVA